ncbi:unnamed protein product [Prorocentrum cordatum]|uniref:Photosystem I reaction center subunit IX n=1 Tax=Prorocentrum cordatum TaxID=2364126 RepID=A0ABN9XPE5_9DINO|nr:unnamed protein product [Polarella glacialis]CAK0901767.1 unnamed protein product [Polarella glacialis]
MARLAALCVAALAGAALFAGPGFVSGPAAQQRREASVSASVLRNNQFEDMTAYDAPRRKPNFNGIRTGLSDLLKPLNSEYGVTAKEDSPATYVVLVFAIVMLFLFYTLLLLINNQSVLLPPEDEFDEYVANFLPYFFFGER